MTDHFDPVTLKVVWDRLISISEEMGATLVRTAFSTVVRESADYACVLLDPKGNSLAQPRPSIPAFIGTMPATVRHFLAKFPAEALRPGDGLITNDPWLGTGHVPDMTIATPVFNKAGRLVAFAGSIAHMPDIGGTINYGATRSVFEEGIRIPIAKLVKAGELNQELMEIIRTNVRVPDQVTGDLMSMLSANWVGAARLLELMEDEGVDDLTALAEEIHSRSEATMRAAIRTVPEGTYRGSAEGDALGRSFRFTLAVHIRDGSVHVDAEQVTEQLMDCSFNSAICYTYAFTVYPLKCLLHPHVPNNEGCFRPFTVTAPPGSILNAVPPAAVEKRNRVGHFLHAAIFEALAPVLPERVMGVSGSAPTTLENFSWLDERGRPGAIIVSLSGGSGACPSKDGEVAMFPSNLTNTPAELIESIAPLLVEAKELICDSGGPGRYRGGLGQRFRVRNISGKPLSHSFVVNRLTHPAQGLLGGGAGSLNRVLLNGRPHPQPYGRWTLEPDDVVTMEYPGGGGLHPPVERDRAKVLEDLQNGFISADSAAQDYKLDLNARQQSKTEKAPLG